MALEWDDEAFNELFEQSLLHMQNMAKGPQNSNATMEETDELKVAEKDRQDQNRNPPVGLNTPLNAEMEIPIPPAPWRTNSSLIGQTLIRTASIGGNDVSENPAVVIGWLNRNESGFFDALKRKAALWRICYTSGELKGDIEDLEKHEVLQSVPRIDLVTIATAIEREDPNNNKSNSKRSSSYTGVFSSGSKWQAVINIDRKRVVLGRFEAEIEAALCYDDHAHKLGRKTNFEPLVAGSDDETSKGITSKASKKNNKQRDSLGMLFRNSTKTETSSGEGRRHVKGEADTQDEEEKEEENEVEEDDNEDEKENSFLEEATGYSTTSERSQREEEEEEEIVAPIQHSSPRLSGVPSRLQKYGNYSPPGVSDLPVYPEAKVASIITQTMQAAPIKAHDKKGKKVRKDTIEKKRAKLDKDLKIKKKECKLRDKRKQGKVVDTSRSLPMMDSLASLFTAMPKKKKIIIKQAKRSKRNISDSEDEIEEMPHFASPRIGNDTSNDSIDDTVEDEVIASSTGCHTSLIGKVEKMVKLERNMKNSTQIHRAKRSKLIGSKNSCKLSSEMQRIEDADEGNLSSKPLWFIERLKQLNGNNSMTLESVANMKFDEIPCSNSSPQHSEEEEEEAEEEDHRKPNHWLVARDASGKPINHESSIQSEHMDVKNRIEKNQMPSHGAQTHIQPSDVRLEQSDEWYKARGLIKPGTLHSLPLTEVTARFRRFRDSLFENPVDIEGPSWKQGDSSTGAAYSTETSNLKHALDQTHTEDYEESSGDEYWYLK